MQGRQAGRPSRPSLRKRAIKKVVKGWRGEERERERESRVVKPGRKDGGGPWTGHPPVGGGDGRMADSMPDMPTWGWEMGIRRRDWMRGMVKDTAHCV